MTFCSSGFRGLVAAALLAASCGACSANGQAGASGSVSNATGTKAPSASERPSSASSPDDDTGWVQVARQAEPSVVSITVTGPSGGGQGSGVVIDEQGHVLTNNHVVAAGTGGQVQVALSDARVFDAEVVGTDPATDLAVIRMDSAPDDLTAVQFDDSEELEVGQPVMALGNPLGLSHTVTVGIVSALDRPVTTQGAGTSPDEPTQVVTNAIQTDAAVNPGNSGGALVDTAGRLVGINSSIATLGASDGGQSGSIGLGFAIPSNQAKWVAQQLINAGRVRHAYLGVSSEDAVVEVDGSPREVAGITEVVAGTPADKAGVRPGDAVIAVDDEPVASAVSLVAQVRERQPGSEVALTVANGDGDTREVSVVFGTRPE
jgi:putative serine protease PepD